MRNKIIRHLFSNFLWLVLILFHVKSSFGQNKGITPINSIPTQQGTIRAVVVGISDYQNKNITDLQFAHEDAIAFVKYLCDPKGMKADSQNVTLLTNEKATAGHFIAALYGLMEEAQKGDIIFIYFSGHGDVESTTINQPGFLLCWDAPSKVYMAGGTFGLAYLQEIVATLSLNTQSKVIVIADACRAGKLAGSAIGGSNATSAYLAKQYSNEIKIMSCQPDEFSLEGKSWGNGRGVFSYYFLAGLQGLADKNGDLSVSLGEIERYLDDKVPPAVAPHSQIPMTTGNKNTPLATVNPEILKKMQTAEIDGNLSPTEMKGITDLLELSDTTLQQQIIEFDRALHQGHLTTPIGLSAWDKLQAIMQRPGGGRFSGILKRNLAAALQDEAQQVINAYLRADAKELEGRWAYDEKYKKYPDQLIKAAELLTNQHFYFKTIMSRYHYFTGLNYRLSAEKQQRSDSLLQLAIAEQMKSLGFLTDAPHVLNELGWINHLRDDHKTAIGYFEDARRFAPEWALPLSNLCIRYTKTKEYALAVDAGLKAIETDSLFSLGYTSLAETYINMKEHDKARLLLYKVLKTDTSNVKAMEFLGYSYSKTKEYTESANWYKKLMDTDASKITAVNLNSLAYVLLLSGHEAKALTYYKKAKSVQPITEYSYQGMIEFYYYTNDILNAEIELTEYVQKFPNDGFAHYLLSSIYAGSAREDKCYEYLELALKKGFDDMDTLTHDDKMKALLSTERFKLLIRRYRN